MVEKAYQTENIKSLVQGTPTHSLFFFVFFCTMSAVETITLLLTQSNLVPGTKNRFRLNLPSGGVRLTLNDTIALQSSNIIYSWPNITAANGNNLFRYVINGTSFDVLISDGFYSIADMNSFLQNVMYARGHYLVKGDGTLWYPISLRTNPTFYAVQFDLEPIPATLPVGWSNPSAVLYNALIPASPAATPQLTIVGNGMQTIFGIAQGTYPVAPSTTLVSVLSSSVPQVTPVQSIVMTCNLLANRVTTPNNVLYSFTPMNVAYGSNIYVQPWVTHVSVCPTTYQFVQLELFDQSLKALDLQDPNVCISLILQLAHQ